LGESVAGALKKKTIALDGLGHEFTHIGRRDAVEE
jgi:hypothetical protein